MTVNINREGLVAGSPQSLNTLASATETAVNADLTTINQNIAAIQALTAKQGGLQIEGVVASNNVTEILTELANRIIALEQA